MTSLNALYGRIAAVHEELADSETRTAEDIRDLVIRFGVVSRCSTEYQSLLDIYKEKNDALVTAFADKLAAERSGMYAKTKDKLEPAIDAAKTEKRESLHKTEQSLQRLIEAKDRYRTFKVHRIVHAWKSYQEDHTRLFLEEKGINDQIVALLNGEETPVQQIAEQLQQLRPEEPPIDAPAVAEALAQDEPGEAAPAEAGATEEAAEPQDPGEADAPEPAGEVDE
jgi:hypothetical protein